MSLLKHRQLPRQSQLYRLEPYLGQDGLLRVGGRLQDAKERTGPILLPRDHPVTKIIAREAHAVGAGHSRREHTLSILWCEFWIARCRPLLDKIIKECVTCRRNNWKPTRQMEAMLPDDRTKPRERPFTYTGTDCFGPFTVRQGRKSTERYGCIFTCLATRAVHLEVLESLDTDALLNATVRFIARKGTTPKRIRSDNGSNMVGACKELRAAVRRWRNDERINRHFQKKDIEWVFNPPAASHMGGVWERQIQTVRKVLRAIVGTQVLDEYRLQTLFCEVEAIINNRLITPASSDVRDLEALTPAHILHGGPHADLSLGGCLLKDSYQRRWRHVQFLAERFWKRWVREYLPLLCKRQKYIEPTRNLQEGDLVLVTGENLPRNKWPLGRVTAVVPGADGLVRQVRVQTVSGEFRRPVTRVCLLEHATP
ncbi:uncharacterized protein LOC121861369 [Homarus americanus]|uniref:uncharacterized protein LOC121861369 n=1 Tax=Homarus americanus TaxID=6706 RepID=UPI001C46ECD8|nr:uncharacterized protein LOC121861369 [Homarus americanus]